MRRASFLVIALGLYLTLRGYHSRDGDQAYRLPLLLHAMDPALYASDPFVRAFDAFNPHRGYLAILGGVSRIAGLSAALAFLFAATFGLTVWAFDRMARSCLPDLGPKAGAWAVALVLIAKAGNLGTNHLFEAMLLDRLMALALGWAAIGALVIGRSMAPPALALGAAAVIHPSLGLQLGALAIGGLLLWGGIERRLLGSLPGASLIALAILPGVAFVASGGSRLMDGLPAEDYLTLAASVQSPQHMLPHLWRMPQWLAAGCYLVLAGMAAGIGIERAVGGRFARGARLGPRGRVVGLLGLLLVALGVAWLAIECVGSVRMTVFQPFRLATVARGLCLVLISGRVARLWDRGDPLGRSRAVVIAAGLSGDWAFVAATLFEVAATLAGRFGRRAEWIGGGLALAVGVVHLARHDTESGHVVLIGATVTAMMLGHLAPAGPPILHRRRRVALAALAWAVPLAAWLVPAFSDGRLARRLAAHCRFGEWADDDVERLALWCRDRTPETARFVGPPGPKTFRLWSRREVAFNRAASPYHAAGLADWSERFREHVGFAGSIPQFAERYLKDRQALEHGFDRMSGRDLAELARRQGAGYVLASSRLDGPGPLRLLRAEGRYAVYRVESPALASRP